MGLTCTNILLKRRGPKKRKIYVRLLTGREGGGLASHEVFPKYHFLFNNSERPVDALAKNGKLLTY